MSAKYNLVCEQGATFNFQFQVQDNNNGVTTPWNLTNYDVIMTVKPYINSTTTTLLATNTNGYVSIDGLNGRVTVTVPYAVTAGFEANRQVYDLLFDSGTVVTRILEGTFVITPAVGNA
jgi:hypothetical protein